MEETNISHDANELLEKVGGLGSWQKSKFLLLSLVSAAAGLAVVVFSFVGRVPGHRCPIPYCPNDTSFFRNDKTFSSSCSYSLIPDMPIPLEATVETCSEYINLLNGSKTEQVFCPSDTLLWDFETGVKNSIATDNGWYCDRSYLKNIMAATYMIGMLIGSFTLGVLSDKIGRVKALMLSIFLASIVPYIGSIETNPYIFGFLRIITGMGGIGCFMISFVLSVEYVSSKYTTLIGLAIEIPFAIGEAILGIEAYLVRDWIILQKLAYLPLASLAFLWFFLPESPRWLIATGKKTKAFKVLNEIAITNGNQLISEKPEKELEEALTLKSKMKSDKKTSIWSMFVPWKMGLRTLNMFFQWFATTFGYYGLTFVSTNLSKDIYTNFILSVLIEIPSYLFCMGLMDSWGRKPILSLCQSMAGICCIMAGLLYNYDSMAGLRVALALIGKFGASASFAIIYVYSAELYPTTIRNTAIGSCSCVARFGGIFASLVGLTNSIWEPMPLVIMGSFSFLAGCLALFLPETLGEPLPETIDQAINIGQNSNGRSVFTCTKPWWFSR